MSAWQKFKTSITDAVADGRAVSDLQTFKLTVFNGELLSPGTGMRKYAVANATRHDAAGVRATIETSGSVNRRATATRIASGVALFGPIGLLAGASKKRVDDRETVMLVEGPEFALIIPVPPEKRDRALKLAAEITTLGKVTK